VSMVEKLGQIVHSRERLVIVDIIAERKLKESQILQEVWTSLVFGY
jgi:RNase P/RNase MRP subunit POP5